MIEVSAIESLPDWKVTTGATIASEAIIVSVTTSPMFPVVIVELFEAMLTLVRVGAIISAVVKVALAAMIALLDASSTVVPMAT